MEFARTDIGLGPIRSEDRKNEEDLLRGTRYAVFRGI